MNRIKQELVTVDLNKLALLLEEVDELKEANNLLRRTVNNLVIDREVGIANDLKVLKEENASLIQEKKNSDKKLNELYNSYVQMEKLYTDYIDKHNIVKNKCNFKHLELSDDRSNVLEETEEFLNSLDVKV